MTHKCIVALFVSFSGTLMATEQQQKFIPIKLNPTIIGLIDGKSYAISGEMIGAMYKVIRDLQEIQLGTRTKSGNREGKYIYKNQKCCIKDLVPIEIEIKKKLVTLKNRNNPLNNNEITNLEKDLAELKKLQNCLNEDFKKIAEPFMGDVTGAKDPLVVLLEEECEKRNIPHSLLLGWTILDTDELNAFERDINTIVLFDEFCTDLINFMSDLIYNCKKGRAQFEKLLNKYIQSQNKI